MSALGVCSQHVNEAISPPAVSTLRLNSPAVLPAQQRCALQSASASPTSRRRKRFGISGNDSSNFTIHYSMWGESYFLKD